MEILLFYVFSTMAIVFAVNMIITRKPVSSAISLVAVMFCLAVLFVLLQAHLLAALQILVYAGAIMVLFLFVIMLLNLREKEGTVSYHVTISQFAGVAIIGAILMGFMANVSMGAGRGVSEGFGTTAGVGRLLFTEYLLPFEIASILLLAALVGAVVLTKIKLR